MTGEVEHVVDEASGVALSVPPGWHRSAVDDRVPARLVVVHAGDRGCCAMASAPEPGVVAFRATASYDVWLRRQELVAEAGAAD